MLCSAAYGNVCPGCVAGRFLSLSANEQERTVPLSHRVRILYCRVSPLGWLLMGSLTKRQEKKERETGMEVDLCLYYCNQKIDLRASFVCKSKSFVCESKSFACESKSFACESFFCELNLVGGTYAERCNTRLYWPVSMGVTAW